LSNVTWKNSGLENDVLPTMPTFQLITTHDAIHDMAHPSAVLPHVRKVRSGRPLLSEAAAGGNGLEALGLRS
jgi:hypothetical protein